MAAHFLVDEDFHSTTDFLPRRRVEVWPPSADESLHRPSQHVFFPNLLHRASDPVVVHRRGSMLVLFHPANNIGALREVSAKREDFFQTFAGDRHHAVAKTIDVAVKVSEKSNEE